MVMTKEFGSVRFEDMGLRFLHNYVDTLVEETEENFGRRSSFDEMYDFMRDKNDQIVCARFHEPAAPSLVCLHGGGFIRPWLGYFDTFNHFNYLYHESPGETVIGLAWGRIGFMLVGFPDDILYSVGELAVAYAQNLTHDAPDECSSFYQKRALEILSDPFSNMFRLNLPVLRDGRV